LCPLLGDDDIAALDRLIIHLPQRLGPRLAREAAVASWAELLAITKRRGQLRVEPAADRHCARDVLAGIAVAVKGSFCGRAQSSAKLFVLGKFCGHRGIGDREVIAVAGSDAQRPVRARERTVRRRRHSAEQIVEKAAWTGGDVLPILRSAIVLPQRHQDPAALRLALTAV